MQPFRSGRLFSFVSKGGGSHSYFPAKSPQDIEERTGRGQLFLHGGVHLHRRHPAGLYHRPVQHHLHKAGVRPCGRSDGQADPAVRRHQQRDRLAL